MSGATVHRHRVRVGYADTDQGGVVHHSVYLRYLEAARTEWFRTEGIDYRSVEYDQKLGLPVAECVLKYRRPAHFDDVLDIDTWIGKCGRASLRFDYQIFRGETHLTDAAITLACVELPRGKLRSLPEMLLAVCRLP